MTGTQRRAPASPTPSRQRAARPVGGGAARPKHAPRVPGPKHAPRVPFALLVLGLVIGGMCALLALNTASAANELARHGLAAKDADVAAQVQQLHNQVAASAAPGALGSAAAALGMVPAANPAFLQVASNGSVRLLGSPAAASAAVQPPATSAARPSISAPASRAGARPTGTKSATARAKSTTPGPTPDPTPSPTPTTTLPGGPR